MTNAETQTDWTDEVITKTDTEVNVDYLLCRMLGVRRLAFGLSHQSFDCRAQGQRAAYFGPSGCSA